MREYLAKAQKLLDNCKLETRHWILVRTFVISVCYFFAGLLMAAFWVWITPPVFLGDMPDWSKMPLSVLIFSLGWFGYLTWGFSVGWLFNVNAALRVPTAEKLWEHRAAVTDVPFTVLGHALYLGLIIVALIFLEGEIEQIEKFAQSGQASGFFIGILAGFAEKRVRDFMNSLFDRF